MLKLIRNTMFNNQFMFDLTIQETCEIFAKLLVCVS